MMQISGSPCFYFPLNFLKADEAGVELAPSGNIIRYTTVDIPSVINI